jgi:hypothetical protein
MIVECKITGDCHNKYKLLIDGVDVSDRAFATRLDIEAGCFPVLYVLFKCDKLDIDLPSCEVVEKPCGI